METAPQIQVKVNHPDGCLKNLQRSIKPVFVKDALGNFSANSTATFVEYKKLKFIAFAGHACVENDGSTNQLAMLPNNGEFQFVDMENVVLFKDLDLALWHVDPGEGNAFVNFIDLNNIKEKSEKFTFEPGLMSWIGFRSKTVTDFHGSKIHTARQYFDHSFTPPKAMCAEYTNLGGQFTTDPIKDHTDTKVAFHYDGKNATFLKAGHKPQAPTPKGMSGGALFFLSGNYTNTEDNKILDVSDHLFAGLGLEWYGKKYIIGTNSRAIIAAIELVIPQIS